MQVFDNGGASYDRYTVIPFGNEEGFYLSHDCDSPNGVSIYAAPCYPVGEEVPFSSLPANVQQHALARIAELCGEYGA
jgi:hypothetical protein